MTQPMVQDISTKPNWQCEVDVCISARKTDRFCSAHWNRFNRYGTPTPERTCKQCKVRFVWVGPAFHSTVLCLECYAKRMDQYEIECAVSGCDRRAFKNGLCRGHRSRTEDTSAVCTGCDKPFEHIGLSYRHMPYCSECLDWITTYEEHVPVSSGVIDGLRYYGLSIVDYIKILVLQDFKCAIGGCGATFNGNISRNNGFVRLSVDHDHSCHPKRKGCKRCVRGLVCNYCNRLIGMAEENIGLLHSMTEYLANPPARKVLS